MKNEEGGGVDTLSISPRHRPSTGRYGLVTDWCRSNDVDTGTFAVDRSQYMLYLNYYYPKLPKKQRILPVMSKSLLVVLNIEI